MIRRTPRAYLALFAAILLVLSIPKSTSEWIRGAAAAVFSPGWKELSPGHPEVGQAEEKLKLENSQLHNEISRLQELLHHERYLNRQLRSLYSRTKVPSEEEREKRQREELKKLLTMQLQAIPAQVIFRSPSSWSSSLWINVGEDDNDTLGDKIIAKNSPVVLGSSVVGVVDYVGKHQSRVKLITDSGLTPSVRAARGEGRKQLLAKGELYGSSMPLWRSQGQLLKGVGFNYDFPDEEGPARDLRSGMPVHSSSETEAVPLLKVNDLLVTTGMDGVFPAGLAVAKVTRVHSLKEGDYYYELEAKPMAGNLQELSLVFVMPPVGYDPTDKPPTIGQ